MRRFTELYEALDRTTSTNAKIAALAAYFRDASPADAAWATFFLTGRRLKRVVPSAALWTWAQELTALPDWLLRECYGAAGDFAEVIALVLDTTATSGAQPDLSLAAWVEERILPLRATDLPGQRAEVTRWWLGLPRGQRFVLNKLLTGEFRVGVAQTLVIRALAEAIGTEPTIVAARLMGDWTPTADWYKAITAPASLAPSGTATGTDVSQPYPFFLASPLEGPPEALGAVADWLGEWKWDGIRAQLVRRSGQVWLWSRGEALITHRFPEIAAAATPLPDGTVLDGEVLAFKDGRPMPFSALQQRIGRQRQVAQIMRSVPAAFIAYDVLERSAADIRHEPLSARRQWLTDLVGSGVLHLSEAVTAPRWADLAALRLESRARGVEGFMLKRRESPYGVGRRKGAWWKWKIDPFTVDAVLIYAQPGNGRRASLLTDYTFGVWHEGALVPVAKAYSGLDDEEIRQVDAFVRRNTLEKFGPVRTVRPELVMELAFEGIQLSTRHKSGIAVRFPRISRWRHDKRPEDADTLD